MKRGRHADSIQHKPRHRSKRLACRQCRQAKIRCELSTGGSIPCSRCRRSGYDCKLDTEFQRVNKRERLEELEREVQELRSSVSSYPPPNLRPVESNLSLHKSFNLRELPLNNTRTSAADDDLLLPQLPLGQSSLGHEAESHGQVQGTPRLSTWSSTSPRSLDYLRLDPHQINALFYLYFQRYHPYVPFLDPGVSSDEYYTRSPLLFWTILCIASRRHVDEPGLYLSLTSPVRKLMWETISNPPHTWHVVQAILLVCLWPFPANSLSVDTTSILVSTAQTISVRLGLHRPEAIQDFSRTKRRLSPSEISEVARTWSTCYIAAQITSSFEGQSLVSSDWMTERLCDRDRTGLIPTSLKTQLIISRFSARVCQFMSGHPHSPTGLPRPGEGMSLLALLEQEFMELYATLVDHIEGENNILLNGAGLQLYVFYLLDGSNGSDVRKRGLLKAFEISTETIFRMSDLDTSFNLMEYGPVSYFRFSCLAAMFILKLSYSNLAPFLDTERGKRAFNRAVHLIRRISLEDNDLPGRTSKILTQLWSAQARSGQRNKEPGLKLKTRLAASLVHDSLWTWREEFGGQRSAPQTPPRNNQSTFGPEMASVMSQEDSQDNELSLEDMVDAEILSLLPFSFDCDTMLDAQ